MDMEILPDYLVEAREMLEKAQEGTLLLEGEPGNQDALASVFRAVHTIKGGASFLDVGHLVEWAHHLESLLDKLRSGSLAVTSGRIDAVLKGLDVIDQMLRELAQGRSPAAGPAELGRLIRTVAAQESDDAGGVREARAPEAAASTDSFHEKTVSPAPSTSRSAEVVENSLRIDALRLDAVMNQVGELVLLRNRLASAVSSLAKENEDMSRIAREMDLTVNDLQNTVMHLRMQPCKRLFQQLPRVVRDVSRQLGKDVRLEIVGEDVEIDKTVVDALSAPITHLVRNGLDHGIELPEIRAAANKSPTAVLRVAAVHLGDKVRIEVADDGSGIDRRFVIQKAIDKGVITAEQAAHLSEQEALELIFRPGFSTKEQASDLSGRGVGMDVVKETMQRLRGRLTIDTHPGRGTRIAMEFPLTLAVLPVLYLRLRQDIYALPISSIDSLTDVEDHRVHRLGARVTYRVDGTQTVPLVDLGAVLQDKPLRMGAESVEGVLTERGLFIVSEVLGNEDSVVKPIDFLTSQNWYQGATISGRGNVVLILDAVALSAAAAAATGARN
jgi:two-component system, chemotaxis family, sensor kinase CheA